MKSYGERLVCVCESERARERDRESERERERDMAKRSGIYNTVQRCRWKICFTVGNLFIVGTLFIVICTRRC